MSTTDNVEACREVEEELASILDGTASARLYDHVAECDACRDGKHEASAAAERVRDAGADFSPGGDFVERLVARLDAARPASSGPAVEPGTAESVRVARDTSSAPASSHGDAAPTLIAVETAATILDPLAAMKVADAEAEGAARTEITLPSARGGAFDASAPAGATREEAPSPLALASSEEGGSAPSGVSATTHHGVASHEGKPGSYRTPAEPPPEQQARAAAAVADRLRLASMNPARERDAPPARRRSPIYRRPAFLAGTVGAMAAAAALGFYLRGKDAAHVTTRAPAPWSGSVTSVARASADKVGGLDACQGEGACAALAGGADVRPGATLRTDTRTRAHLRLADGTDLAIDRASEVELVEGRDRSARIARGTVVADVARVEGAPARFSFPHGDIDVAGVGPSAGSARLAITAGDDRTSVEVARGAVRVRTSAGRTVEVRAGEEAMISGDLDPVVGSTTSLADVMEWSDDKPEEVDSPVLRGLGELRAKKPGQTSEKDHAVRLAKHAVKVRVVDLVARTEVDETFTNDTDEELEGIFRFPLPPGAQIERLALEVDGKLVEGAFVDRDKGAAIWRGVIQNAAPKAPKPKDEIFWVPGPWRDPALLEWQRGGRFELKIFPIPRRGSRRVVLAYTQVVEQAAGVRRFVYPLAHDPSGSTRVGSFDLDVQVLGADRSVAVTTRGYDLTSVPGEGDRRTMHADDFVPAGDLTVEYALPDRDKEVTAWAYAMPPKESFAPAPTASAAPAKPASPEAKAAEAEARAIVEDASPYVAIALRPRLPRWQEAKERLHVIVVDASRSMFGERFARATHLASGIVREMDRRDSFMVLACDTVCRAMGAEAGQSARPLAPSADAAGEVERFLGTTEPEGGSDLAASIAAARAAAGPLDGKELRILYLGDGTPTVGPTRPAHLEAAVRGALPAGQGAVVAVALGADADTTSLAALARGGGGVVVPYVPGQRVSTAALDALGAAYGVMLRDPEVELPAGLSQVTPARLDPIRAGGETILVARMAQGADVSGTLKLRGRVAGERFEQTYPIKIVPSTSAGNAFVPRLYAAAKIAELEQRGGEAPKAAAIELSRRFAVASRFTSLLVLESAAMFKAFGLERSATIPGFTGEQQAESSTADGEAEVDKNDVAGGGNEQGDELGRLGGAHAAASQNKEKAYDGSDDLDGALGSAYKDNHAGPMPAARRASPAPAAAAPTAAPGAFSEPPMDMKAVPPPAPPPPAKMPFGGADRPALPQPREEAFQRRRFVPMRRVFERHVGFDAANTLAAQNAGKLGAAESALAAAPDSRDRTVELFALYATSGRLGDAQELTAKWAGRDALDPDALLARADLAARQGDRERAVRILGGLADLRPNDRAVQVRLADLHDAAGEPAQACEHRVALADMAPGEAKLVAAAIRCARAQGMPDLASVLRLDAGEKVREAIDALLAGPAPSAPAAHGDVQISAEWSGGEDLDLALIDAQGRRTSWLGSAGKATVSARDVKSTHDESLDVAGLPAGSYVVEVARASGRDAGDTVRGEITLRLNGETRRVPFTLTGPRAEVGTVRVFFTSHLEPVAVPWGGREGF